MSQVASQKHIEAGRRIGSKFFSCMPSFLLLRMPLRTASAADSKFKLRTASPCFPRSSGPSVLAGADILRVCGVTHCCGMCSRRSEGQLAQKVVDLSNVPYLTGCCRAAGA